MIAFARASPIWGRASSSEADALLMFTRAAFGEVDGLAAGVTMFFRALPAASLARSVSDGWAAC